MIARATLFAVTLHALALALLSLAPPATRSAPDRPADPEPRLATEPVTLVSIEPLDPPIPRPNAYASRTLTGALPATALREASTPVAQATAFAARGGRGGSRSPATAAPPTGPGPREPPEATQPGDPDDWSSTEEELGIAWLDAARGRVRYSDALADAPPAPTRPPRARRIGAAETHEAVRALVRLADRELGMGAPHEGRVALAVQEAGRASGVPSGTRFSVTLRIDRDGAVSEANLGGDEAFAGAWSETLTQIRAALASAPIPLGPDARDGVTVVVEAQVLHVLAAGTTEGVVMGACPQLAQVGGEAQPNFFNVGGTPFLEPPTGLCPLGDASNGAPKTIQVRTTTRSRYANEAPPPVTSFARPRPKKLLLTPSEIVLKLLHPSSKP